MLRTITVIITIFYFSETFAQLSDTQIRDLKSGRRMDDTSYVYSLPWSTGRSVLFIQGSNSIFSHKDELAYDFKMRKGMTVCAAREGMVMDSRADSKTGGLKPEMINEGNFVIIRHDDNSTAWYWHLQANGVNVKPGDRVSKGQVIGLSGNTGYSAFPHLHFQVFDATGRQVLVRFSTRKGNVYLRPGKFYKRKT
jgi:murein DD-endopeptidase MepM/ murein hydrolase activator NlpD